MSVNVQQGYIGTGRSASVAQEVKFSTPNETFVNALKVHDGMDLAVQQLKPVLMVVSGMCLSLCVSVRRIVSGMVHSVLRLSLVGTGRYLMEIMDVCVRVEHIGMESGVSLTGVQVGKHGTETLVFVNKGITLMGLYVCCVLMGRCGIVGVNHVNVQQTIPGMGISVRRECFVLGSGCSMNCISNVCVLMELSGMVTLVWSSLNAAAGRSGMKVLFSATAHNLSTGMGKLVCCA